MGQQQSGATDTLSNESDFNVSNICNYNRYSYGRYMFIVYLGSPVAFVGIFANTLLVYLFRGRQNRHTPTLYFTVLAVLDIAVCTLYLLLFSTDAVAVYHRLEPLWRLWMSYVMPLLTLSRIIQIASTYIVVAASLERFLFVTNLSQQMTKSYCTRHQRYLSIACIAFTATVLRFPTYFEYTIVDKSECYHEEPLASLQFDPLLANNTFYSKIYNFYFMHFVQVFAPIAALLILNIAIVYQLQRQLNFAKRFLFTVLQKFVFQQVRETKVSKEQIRSATSSLVAMVTSYLMCNSMHLLLSVLEHVAKTPLLVDEYGETTDLYDYLTDVICFLFMFNSFLRLFIYMGCNYDLREMVVSLVFRKPKPLSFVTSLIFATNQYAENFVRRRQSRYNSTVVAGHQAQSAFWPFVPMSINTQRVDGGQDV